MLPTHLSSITDATHICHTRWLWSMNHPKWIQCTSQILFTLFIHAEEDSSFQHGSSWSRAFSYQCCLLLFNLWKNDWKKKSKRRNILSACTTSYAYSQNCEKRRLASSWLRNDSPPVSLHGKKRLQLDEFSLNFISEDSSKICGENSSFTKIWQKKNRYIQ